MAGRRLRGSTFTDRHPLTLSTTAPESTTHPKAGSAAIDAAPVAAANVPATDFNGVARPQGAAPDMGAFEFGASPPLPLKITTASLPAGTQSSAYSQTLTATGGAGGYTWSIGFRSAAHRPGTPAAPACSSGTPTQAGPFNITIQVQDAANKTDPQAYTHTNNTATSGNQPPTIDSGPSIAPAAPTVGVNVIFTASATDPNGDALTYAWLFGDGSSAAGPTVSHVYAAAGMFTIQITTTVTDTANLSAQKTVSLTVTAATGSPEITEAEARRLWIRW